MKRKSARPSFSRRPSFNKREKTDKGGRIRQRNQRLALLVLLLLLVVTGVVILMVRKGQKHKITGKCRDGRTVTLFENGVWVL